MYREQADVRLLRARPRLKVFHTVEIRHAGGTVRGHLLDLSGGGALAYCAQPPTVGADILVMLGDRLHSGTVVWRDGRRFGIAFAFRMTDAEIDHVIAQEAGRRMAALNR